MHAVDDVSALDAMDRYAAGDRAAFARVHAFVAPLVRTVLARYLVEPSLVDDAVQATFLRAHRARTNFRPEHGPGSVKAWFATLARHVALDTIRIRMRTQRRLDRARRVEEWLDERSLAERPDEQWDLARREQLDRNALESALLRLPPSQREVVRSHYLRGEPFVSIARRLGTSASSLRLRAHRARASMRRHLEHRGYDPIANPVSSVRSPTDPVAARG